MPRLLSMVEATRSALDALGLEDGDQAAATLALRYAHTIDEARDVAAGLARVRIVETDAGYRALEALRARVAAQSVLSELGPKLTTLLETLGGTPAARSRHERASGRRSGPAASRQGAPAPRQAQGAAEDVVDEPGRGAAEAAAAALDELRARRAARG